MVLQTGTVKKICAATLLISLGLISIAGPAEAGLIDIEEIAAGFAKGILGVMFSVIGLVLNLFVATTSLGLAVAVTIFNWVTSPNFISLSYTNPADNSFLEVGWNLTRSLTNIIFVIAMVAIGLGTALRISGYQMQKALPALIAMALLINFTPVITGLIVDAANIVTNFFMTSVAGSGNIFSQLAKEQANLIFGLVGGLAFWDPTAIEDGWTALIGSIAVIFFNIIASIIYLLFALLFVMRYVVIWILVILSPFAFACYILPYTKHIWSQWWKMFIQWSILGVIMGFFLYLAGHFTFLATQGGILGTSAGETPDTPGLSAIFNNLMPFFIPLVLLMVGLTLAIAGAPQGAGAIMQGGKRAANVAIAMTTRKLGRSLPAEVSRITGLERSIGTFRHLRTGGMGWRQSLAETARRQRLYLSHRIKPSAIKRDITKYLPRDVASASIGAFKAVRDIAKATMSASGVIGKKRGLRPSGCPVCGKRKISFAADTCPVCGHKF